MLKRLLSFSLAAIFIFLAVTQVSAIDRPHFVSFVNPVRGLESWGNSGLTPLDLPRFQYFLASKYHYPVSWLLRFDAVQNATVSAFFADLTATDSSQTLGAFLEVTPKLTGKAGVEYPPGETIFAADRIFLSGYSQPDRLKLIDTYMQSFYDRFGYYPRIVGAWQIDAYSLEYLQKHYSVVAAVICDEQYSTDNYRFWGGYIGSPYFPSRLNFLQPAQTRNDRINLIITKWAQRDPGNFYGFRGESNYSTQVNDYTANGLKANYFADLLGIYSNGDFNEVTQTNIGLENDYPLSQYKQEISATYAAMSKDASKDNLRFVPLADFASWMATRYSFTNPAFFYQVPDITGKTGKITYWYQNPFFRIGLRSDQGRSSIIDFRLYNAKEAEDFYLTKNINRTLFAEVNPIVDSVKYPGAVLNLDIDLSQARITFDHWKVSFRVGDKELRLEPQQIVFANLAAPTINTEEVNVSRHQSVVTWEMQPKLPFTGSLPKTILVFGLLAALAVFLCIRMKSYLPVLLAGFAFGSFTLITLVRSGIVYIYGLGLWGPNGHDAIFHLSLDEHFKQFPLSLMHPQIAGEKLMNYHFGFDWLTGILARLTQLPLLDIFFRFLPIFLILTLVYAVMKLLILWRYSRFEMLLSFALMFLAGSAGFIANIFLGRNPLAGESIFWSNQSVSLLLNPPFALSLTGLIIFLFYLEKHPHRLSKKELLLLSLLGGFLVQIKIYAFLLLAVALLLKKKFRLFLGVCLTGFIFILPSLGLSGSPFVFNPLWFPRTMFESFDRLYSPTIARAWQVYENNGVFLKLIIVNLLAVVVFYAGNLYFRLLGLSKVVFGRDFNLSQNIVRLIIIFGLVIPLLFTQKVNPWNTIQFLYYSLFFLAFFTAKQIGEWFAGVTNRTGLFVIFAAIVTVSSVTSIGTLEDYLTSQSASRVSLTELRALDLLRRSPPGTVISPFTYSRYLPPIPDPRPLYAYTSTAYISALTGHPEYLADTINLDITGFSYQDRVKNVFRLYQTRDFAWVKKFLQDNNIIYVYETVYDRLMVRSEDVCLTKIFDSGEINLYKYSCHD